MKVTVHFIQKKIKTSDPTQDIKVFIIVAQNA